jgi:hypothetical protein
MDRARAAANDQPGQNTMLSVDQVYDRGLTLAPFAARTGDDD